MTPSHAENNRLVDEPEQLPLPGLDVHVEASSARPPPGPGQKAAKTEALLVKVRRLRALSTSTNVHEAAAAAAAADRIVLEHRLEETRLGISTGGPVEDEHPLVSSRQREQWRWLLVDVLAQQYSCVTHEQVGFQRGWSYLEIWLVGRPEDIAAVRAMYDVIVPVVLELGHDQGRFAASFRVGVVQGIASALALSRQAFDAGSPDARALDLHGRVFEAFRRLVELHPGCAKRWIGGTWSSDPLARRDGFAAGREVDVVGGGRRRLPGGS